MKDLREFIEFLEQEGQLRRIDKEVDWNLEIGAVSRRCCERKGPALLFEKVKDYPGQNVMANSLSTLDRLSLAMGLGAKASYPELVEAYIERTSSPIKPVEVADGPCKEVVEIGQEADLLKLPVPQIHQGDGGRYLGTWHLTINKDPGTEWVNWGMYRAMVHDRQRLGMLFVTPQHGPFIYSQKYESQGVPMPISICIGTDPLCALTACNPFEYGVSEVDIAGGLRGSPVELIRCETNDLLVPAHSEIVIEGEMLPDERELEGPFGEYTGYMAGGRAKRPVFHVKAVTHRRNPILTMSNMGMPLDDSDVANSVGFAARMTVELRRKGIPFRDVVCVAPECSLALAVVSLKRAYAGIAHQVASIIWGDKAGQFTPFVVVCEEDVDPSDLEQVAHAITSRCHPMKNIHPHPDTTGNPLSPFATLTERSLNIGNKCLFDCTWPVDWPPEAIPDVVSFATSYPKELQERVIKEWSSYGLD